MRVSRPPANPQRAPQLAPVPRKDAGQFKQRRVAGRVVSDPLVPGIQMPVYQQEFLRFLITFNPDSVERTSYPTLIETGLDANPQFRFPACLDKARSIRSIHAHNRGRRLEVLISKCRGAPDGSADSFMDSGPRVNVNLRPRPALLILAYAHGHREPFADYDLARDVDRSGRPARRKHVIDFFHFDGRNVDHCAFHRVSAGRQRKGRRLGANRAQALGCNHFQLCSPWHAD